MGDIRATQHYFSLVLNYHQEESLYISPLRILGTFLLCFVLRFLPLSSFVGITFPLLPAAKRHICHCMSYQGTAVDDFRQWQCQSWTCWQMLRTPMSSSTTQDSLFLLFSLLINLNFSCHDSFGFHFHKNWIPILCHEYLGGELEDS